MLSFRISLFLQTCCMVLLGRFCFSVSFIHVGDMEGVGVLEQPSISTIGHHKVVVRCLGGCRMAEMRR